MRRVTLVAALAVLAVAGGSARADVFVVAPEPAALPLALPSAETPNTPGSLLLPAAWTERAIAPSTISYAELEALWRRAGAAYGIPWHVLAAINKIESNFGRNMGPSSAGAVGWMQFMPDTWLRWGTDGDGDRIADPWDPEDGVYSAARYLAAAGGDADLRRSIFAYNHANWYVDDVLELAALFGQGGGETTIVYDDLQEDLRTAERAVVQASEALTAARAERKRTARIEAELFADAARQTLLSDQLAVQRRTTLAGVAAAAAADRVEALSGALGEAERALADARRRSRAASFSPVAGTLLAAPTYSGSYVFPVGGGPSVVSVAATHHDYPAADIAAPEGAPLYALADGFVVRSWSHDSRCGIGFTMRTSDGPAWTYCHLAYLEPTVVAGAALTAGTPVGLVGSTGHSTGPHLHLQLQSPTVYPQAQAWFQSFAGTAFSWQGEAPTLAATAVPRLGDVFAEVASDDDVVFFNR